MYRVMAVAVTVIVAAHAVLVAKTASEAPPIATAAALLMDAVVVVAAWWFSARLAARPVDPKPASWAMVILGILVALACASPLLLLLYFLWLGGRVWGGS